MQEFKDKFNDKKNKKNAGFPFWVLAVSIILTIAVSYNFYQSAVNKDSIRFTNEVARVQSQIENKINLYAALLKSGRGFIESSAGLNRENFARYVENLELEKNYAGVEGIGYVKIVAPGERDALAKEMAAEGYQNLEFPNNEPSPIVRFYEPQTEASKRSIVLDLFADASRRATFEKARDTGAAAASAKITLAEGNGEKMKTGFLIFLPVYKNGGTPPNVEQRKKDLSGYIYSSFRADDFLSEIQKNTTAYDVAIRIFDDKNSVENLLAQTVFDEKQKSPGLGEDIYSSDKEIDVGGRRWIVQYVALPAFAERSSVGWTALIFLSGIIFSLLLFGITYWEVSARETLRKTAEELFELQGQKQILLEKEQKARVAAEQANRAKDEFIAVVSHELRTPLNAIAGWTNILKTENLAARTKDLALEKIEKNLRSQTTIVEELLDFSRIISDSEKFVEKKINFSDLFEEVFAEFVPKAKTKQIELNRENNLNGQIISGDDEKIKLLIENLFSNAVKFTDANGKIFARVLEAENFICLSIKDDGKGISADFLPHIFERFRQSESAMTRNFGGLGLGLAISKHIVRLHGGTIEARSAGDGKGSIFTVRFPLACGG